VAGNYFRAIEVLFYNLSTNLSTETVDNGFYMNVSVKASQ